MRIGEAAAARAIQTSLENPVFVDRWTNVAQQDRKEDKPVSSAKKHDAHIPDEKNRIEIGCKKTSDNKKEEERRGARSSNREIREFTVASFLYK